MKKCCCTFVSGLIIGGIIAYILYKNGINIGEILTLDVIKSNFMCCLLNLLIFVLLFIFYCLINYYCKKEKAIKKHDDMIYRIGYDIIRLLSWPFSVNGLLFFITFAAISLIVFVMIIHWDSSTGSGKLQLISVKSGDGGGNLQLIAKDGIKSGSGSGELQLIAITLSITLATIIPFIISKIAAKGEIEKIIDDRLKNNLDKFDTSIIKILKTNAHENRMSAVLLYQMAEQQKQDADRLESENQKFFLYDAALKNAAWSVGWASTAITEYVRNKDSISGAIKHSQELLNEYLLKTEGFINQCEEKIKKYEEERFKKNPNSKGSFKWEEFKKKNKFVRQRDLISLFTMHAIIKKYDVIKILERNDDEPNKTIDERLTVIEGILLQYLEEDEIPSAKDCCITGMEYEYNDELEKIAEKIIKEARTYSSNISPKSKILRFLDKFIPRCLKK